MKKSNLITGILYVLFGMACLIVALLIETKLEGILWGFAGAGIFSGIMMICKYFYWSSPKNKERYEERLENERIEQHEAVFVALSPHELYERKVTMQELHAAIASLPNKQAKRIYAHFILGMTKQDIARAEGVHEKVVRVAIERGLRRLEKILKNSL